MELSIIIVNYNVRYFLEQCLRSVDAAVQGIEAEIFVVDNASTDGSMEMVASQFPHVHRIVNADNVGFSKANNQAIRVSKGKYVLLLNPDTLVQEDTFSASLAFFAANPQAGGLGIKMVDGRGNYLPESKRGFPSPWVAFCKIIGLTAMFPNNRILARYYMGHLSNKENCEVDVLAGAYMMMPRKVLDEVGLLDEDFFMYGEDIDLSYRIQKGGYTNHYLADSQIIHYKGESTKKGSLNYVYVFYKAMAIFARKHFTGSKAGFYVLFIQMGIFLRGLLAGLSRIIKKLGLFLLDGGLAFSGLYYMKTYWERNHRFVEGGEYPDVFTYYIIPSYILLWMLITYLQGGYDKPMKKTTAIRGVAIGTVILLIAYALLSESWRFSRALILLGAVWTAFVFTVNRLFFDWFSGGKFFQKPDAEKRFFVVGNGEEAKRTTNIIREGGLPNAFIGWIPVEEITSQKVRGSDEVAVGSEVMVDKKANTPIGRWEDLEDLMSVYRPNEIIFCSKDLSVEEIINRMDGLMRFGVEIKILPPDAHFIIGSNSIHQQGDLYAREVRGLFLPLYRRQKRMFDVFASLILLLFFPVTLLLFKQPVFILKSALRVLFKKNTWVGFSSNSGASLPAIPPGIFEVGDELSSVNKNHLRSNLNLLYAARYHWREDAEFLWRKLRSILLI
jgi:GT2 family glycosyltransferase